MGTDPRPTPPSTTTRTPSVSRWRAESRLIASGRTTPRDGEPLNVPIIAASNFRAATPATPADPADPADAAAAHGDAGDAGQSVRRARGDGPAREYARDDATAGWESLEEIVGDLEGGAAVAYSSGMAAISAVLELLPVGARVVVPTDCYGGVWDLLDDGAGLGRWRVERVGLHHLNDGLAAAGRADLLWMESPSNPLLHITDLAALAAAAHEHGARVVVDNTFSPLLQQPLALGADIVVHSATKFIGGHSDLLAGVAVTADTALAGRLRRRREVAGATPGALETFLAVRGARTLALRLEQGQRTAESLAPRLLNHRAVTHLRYPGLPGHPGHGLALRQSRGPGAIISFEVADAATADAVCAAVELISSATSLGGVETLIERRAKLASQAHVPPGLLRLSVGCEHPEDLWDDLENALTAATG